MYRNSLLILKPLLSQCWHHLIQASCSFVLSRLLPKVLRSIWDTYYYQRNTDSSSYRHQWNRNYGMEQELWKTVILHTLNLCSHLKISKIPCQNSFTSYTTPWSWQNFFTMGCTYLKLLRGMVGKRLQPKATKTLKDWKRLSHTAPKGTSGSIN